MTALKKLNQARRWTMHQLTKHVGGVNCLSAEALQEKNSVHKILVSRPNHRLGNLLLITPLLQELEDKFPNSKIDVFLKGGLGPIVLKEYKNINEIIALPKNHFQHFPTYLSTWIKLRKKKYDLVINAIPQSSSGRLSTQFCKARYKLYGDQDKQQEAIRAAERHIAKLPVYCFRQALGKQASFIKEVPTLDMKLSEAEITAGKELLAKMNPSSQKTIAIFTYATGEKCHSKAWWNVFYQALKKTFPDYFILEILPKEKTSQIDFKSATYYSQDLREMCSLLANTAGFIGADSGIMHLAVASKTPVMGLFCVTDLNKYQPYGRKNIAVDTTQVNIPEIISLFQQILK